MAICLPTRIMNYNVSSSSPTDELLTVGQILSEVGDFASTILDREHLSLSRKCMTRLNKVVGELVSRQCIQTADSLYDISLEVPVATNLKSLTIAELHSLYRYWPIRHKNRDSEDRESFSFYYEGRIVRELKKRKATNKSEQLKIDYCVATYRNELDNMSFAFSLPVQLDDEKIYPEYGKQYTPEELTALISLYSDYRDITEREILVEYVDSALDWMEQNKGVSSNLELLSEIAELGRRKIVRIPQWVNRKLEDTVHYAITSKTGSNVDLAVAMLTLQIINKDLSLERKAQRIINRCHKSAYDDSVDLGERISCLHTAVTCSEYVSRFSIRKVAKLWNELSGYVLSSGIQLSAKQIFQLLEVAKECEDYAYISADSKYRLQQMLEGMVQSDCLEAKALSKIIKLKI